MSDFARNAPPTPPSGGGGGGIPLKSILQILSNFLPKPPDLSEQLRARILSIELSKMLNGSAIPYATATWEQVMPQEDLRGDYLLLGRRGSGKTALACAIAQHYASLKRRVVAVDWPEGPAKALGFDRCTRNDWMDLRDAAVLLDEAALRRPKKKTDDHLFEALALARHRNIACIWTSQTTAAISRDVLRMESFLTMKALDPIATKFEREELVDMAAQAVTIQTKLGFDKNPRLTLFFRNNMWVVAETPLPIGWTPQISRLWS
jgi:hypothetical protein